MEENIKGRGRITSIRIKPINTRIEYEDESVVNLPTFDIFSSKSPSLEEVNFSDYGLENFNTAGLNNDVLKIFDTARKISGSHEATEQVKNIYKAYEKIAEAEANNNVKDNEEIRNCEKFIGNVLAFDITRLYSIKLNDVRKGKTRISRSDFKKTKSNIEMTALEACGSEIISDDSIIVPDEVDSNMKKFFKKFKMWLGLGGTVAALAGGAALIDNNEVTENKAIEQEANLKEDTEANLLDDSDLKKNNDLTDLEAKKDEQKNEFIESLKVKEETTKDEIDGLKTKDDVLKYLKNAYIEEYEAVTGDDKLTTNDIKIVYSPQNYEYELNEGTIVSHGSTPAVTEDAIRASGNTIKSINYDTNYYTVYKKMNNENSYEVIDCMKFGKDENFNEISIPVIPGDRYNEMKDGYTSVLNNIAPIVKSSFRLMDVIENSNDVEINNAKEKLTDSIEEHKSNKAQNLVSQENIQNNEIEENEL